MLLNLVKIFLPATISFIFGILITPIASHYFYKLKMWKKHPRIESATSDNFKKIYNGEGELNTPRVGGIIIWVSALATTLIFYLVSIISPSDTTLKLNFLSRSQTLIPFFTLFLGSLIGLLDDVLQIYGNGKISHDANFWPKVKAALVSALSFFIAIWFFYKLGMHAIHIPWSGTLELGLFFIPFFIIVTLATFSGGVIDGLDGLSGGILASIFGAYSVIAFTHNQIDLAAFSGVITGAILAFLWFNIPPARFYMGETGIMGLTVTLATLAFLSDSVLILPVVAMPLVISSLSVILQLGSKRFFGKKLFLVAPIHHHFEAVGWPKTKVTMRFWILSVVFAIIGIILAAIS